MFFGLLETEGLSFENFWCFFNCFLGGFVVFFFSKVFQGFSSFLCFFIFIFGLTILGLQRGVFCIFSRVLEGKSKQPFRFSAADRPTAVVN